MSVAPKNNHLATYQLLHVAQQDLSQAAFFADHLLKKGWSAEPWEAHWRTYLHQCAYMTAMVAAYSRPFTGSRGFPKFPSRLLQLSPVEKRLHERLLALRNEVYAHTDVSARNVRPAYYQDIPTAIETLPPMRMSAAELIEVRKLINKISISMNEKIDSLFQLVAKKPNE